MQQDNVKQHPFYLKWQQPVFGGLNALSKWEHVAHLFKLTSLGDYIKLVYECPRIQECYELTWDFFANTIHYKELALPETDDVLQDISHKMQFMAFKFGSCMKQYSNHLADMGAHLTSCKQSMMDHFNHASSRLAANMTPHMNKIQK